jgi:hypothetical protein
MSDEEVEDPISASEPEDEEEEEEVDEAGGEGVEVEPVEAVVSFESLMEAPTLSWEKLKPASGTAPSARSGHTMTMVGEKLYVFGGCGLAEGIGHLAGTTGSMHVFDTGRSLFIRSFSLLVCIIFATDIFY